MFEPREAEGVRSVDCALAFHKECRVEVCRCDCHAEFPYPD